MEGLEISEVRYSELEYTKRLDSEYYRKEFLHKEAIITNIPHQMLSDAVNFLIGPFGSAFNTENYIDSGEHRYVRGQDVKPFLLRDDDNRYMPKSDFERLSKYALKPNDIMVSVVGTLGNACIVQKKDTPAIFSCKSTVLRSLEIDPIFILTYLNTKFGRDLLLRKERGAIQKGLNLDDLKSLHIPNFSTIIQRGVNVIFSKAQSCNEESKKQYLDAENVLLNELELKDWQPTNEATTQKSFADFLESGRLDAEYYQPKYDEIERRIKLYANGYGKIEDIYTLKDKNTTPKSDVKYRYVELANIGKSGDITGCTEELGCELPSRARRTMNTGDVIVSSIEGSLQSCAIVEEIYNNSLCSTGFYVVNSTIIAPETSLVLFKSLPIQELMKKACSGTILTAMNKDEFLRIPIPIIKEEVQKQIAEKIQESFALRAESKRLLELAKTAVEVAIEYGETKGVELLNNCR